MHRIPWAIGQLVILPHTIVGLLIALVGGTIFRRIAPRYWALLFVVREGGLVARFFEVGAGEEHSFVGITIGAVIISTESALAQPEHVEHELRHVWQQMVAGLLQPITYALFYLWGRARGLGHFEAYRANPWERDARRAAGQEV